MKKLINTSKRSFIIGDITLEQSAELDICNKDITEYMSKRISALNHMGLINAIDINESECPKCNPQIVKEQKEIPADTAPVENNTSVIEEHKVAEVTEEVKLVEKEVKKDTKTTTTKKTTTATTKKTTSKEK